MPLFNGDVIFLDASGQVIARNGDLTLRADDSGTRAVIIGSGSSLRPEKDIATDLGTSNLRWHQLHAGSIDAQSGTLAGTLGFDEDSFNFTGTQIVLQSSNLDLTNAQLSLDASSQFINNGIVDILGTFRMRTNLQAFDGDAVHRVGDKLSRFSEVHAGSGVFNLLAAPASGSFVEVEGHLHPQAANTYQLGLPSRQWSAINVVSGVMSDASISDTLTFNGDVNIVNNGDISWNGNGSTVAIGDMNNWDFGNTPVVIDNLDVVDISSLSRPIANGSGVALQGENYFEVFGGRQIDFANPITSMHLFLDDTGLNPADFYFAVLEDVQIRHYLIETIHLNASQPPAWAIRLRIDGNTNDHASGLFTWPAASNTVGKSFGSLSGTQTIPKGSLCHFQIDSDGAAGHNTAYARVTLGLTVVSGLSQ